MTTTNRAFIKVYRHDAAEPAPPARAANGPEREQPNGVAASIEYVAAATALGTHSAGVERSVAGVAGSIDVLPPTARPFVDSTLAYTLATPPQRAADTSPPGQPLAIQPGTRLDPRQSTKRPLSSYIARARAFESIATTDQAELLRPGTVVASFRWPAVARALSAQCRAELDSVVDDLLTRADEGERTAGFFSLYPRQGCTSVLAALAARLAVRKRKVLLVDANFANPQLAAQLDVVPTAGWQESLISNTPLADSLIRAADDRLDLLALSQYATNSPVESVSTGLAKNSFQKLLGGYDILLFDLGAFFDPRSKPIGLELVRRMPIDIGLAITGPQSANPRDLASLDDSIRECGGKFIGTIENRTAGGRAALAC